MKEIIAKGNKKIAWFIILVSVFSIVNVLRLLKNSSFFWIGIFTIACLVFCILMGVLLLCTPDYVIAKDGENLIIYRGIRKSVIKVSALTMAKPAEENLTGGKVSTIILTAKTDKGEQEFRVVVYDIENVVLKLNEIISNNK